MTNLDYLMKPPIDWPDSRSLRNNMRPALIDVIADVWPEVSKEVRAMRGWTAWEWFAARECIQQKVREGYERGAGGEMLGPFGLRDAVLRADTAADFAQAMFRLLDAVKGDE